ncbi:tyrosine-type recombinase/integrase [Paenibacillus sp. LPE1-1-1.1]|uniref:tyrosine-type recombinase/integrase n=1 Tax=Paenibacillus sp. LPE1-1-1.1 TaxID=3135230 RepID=UPI003441050F
MQKKLHNLTDEILNNKDLLIQAANSGLLFSRSLKILRILYLSFFPTDKITWDLNLKKNQNTPEFEHVTIDNYLAQNKHLKKSSIRMHRSAYYKFLTWTIATYEEFKNEDISSILLSSITEEHINGYYKHLSRLVKNDVLKESSVNYIQCYINSLFQRLYQQEHLLEDITLGIKKIYYERYNNRDIPTNQEISAFLKIVDTYSPQKKIHGLAFEMMLYLGLRKTETSKIRWRDINFSTGTILVTGKNDKEARLIVPEKIINRLKELKEKSTGGYLFGDSREAFADSLYVYYKIFSLMAGWQYPGGLHLLRHVFITRLSEKDCPIQLLKELGRHEKTETTSKYIHRSNKHLEESINKLNYLM